MLTHSPSPLGDVTPRICLRDPPTGLDPHFRSWAGLSLLRNPLASWSPSDWYRNVRLFSIAYAFRPRLRARLTLSGLTFLRKPWVFGDQVSRLVSRYSFRHNHFWFVDHSLRTGFILQQNAPLPRGRPKTTHTRSFGGGLESRTLSAQDYLTSEQLRTL